jgi:predicted HTH domain antitoxin
MSQVLEIEVPDEVLLGLQKDARHFAAEMRVAAAIKWYEIGQLTQAKAAEVAGLSRAAFINELSRYGVTPFQESGEEALQTVKDLGR